MWKLWRLIKPYNVQNFKISGKCVCVKGFQGYLMVVLWAPGPSEACFQPVQSVGFEIFMLTSVSVHCGPRMSCWSSPGPVWSIYFKNICLKQNLSGPRTSFFLVLVWTDRLVRDSGPTNGQNKRMAKFEVNGQIFKLSKTANGYGHSPNRQNSNRRMASQNLIFS